MQQHTGGLSMYILLCVTGMLVCSCQTICLLVALLLVQMLGQPPDLEAAHLLPDNVSHPKARTPLFQAMRSFMDPRTKSKSRTSKASRASDPHDDAASTSSSDSGHSRVSVCMLAICITELSLSQYQYQ